MKSLTMALAAGTLAIGAAPAAAVELAPLAIAQPAPASPTLAAFGDDDEFEQFDVPEFDDDGY